jgi:hypothetical protein
MIYPVSIASYQNEINEKDQVIKGVQMIHLAALG